MMSNKIIIFSISILFFCVIKVFSQKNASNQKHFKKKQKYEHAILKKGISGAADGCGWMIEFPETKKSYKFVEMSDSFEMSDNLDVEVKYEHIDEKYLCGRGRAKIDQIRILDVRIYQVKNKKKRKK